MQYENNVRMNSLFNLDVVASLTATVGMLINYYCSISGYFDFLDPNVGITKHAYLMAGVTFFAIFILFINGIIKNRGGLLMWLAAFYLISAFVSTALSGLYPVQRLPFRFIEMSYWFAVFLLAYYSVLTLNSMKIHVAIVVLVLPLLAYQFYITRGTAAESSNFLLLNSVYYIAYFMPVVLLLKSKVLKTGFLLLIFAVIILSYKRTAILAYCMAILVYFYCLSKTSTNSDIWKTLTVMLGSVVFLGLLLFFFRHLSGMFGLDWAGRMGDMVESGGSNRLTIWHDIAADLAANPGNWLFGKGYLASAPLGAAHNDFLEVLYDFGLLGLILYSLFVAKIIKVFFEMKRLRYRHFDAFAVSLVWFAGGSMLSQLVIYPYWFLGVTMFWGLTIADFENAKCMAQLVTTEDSVDAFSYDNERMPEESYIY